MWWSKPSLPFGDCDCAFSVGACYLFYAFTKCVILYICGISILMKILEQGRKVCESLWVAHLSAQWLLAGFGCEHGRGPVFCSLQALPHSVCAKPVMQPYCIYIHTETHLPLLFFFMSLLWVSLCSNHPQV